MSNFEAIIIGGGAAGLMCALTAGGLGKKVLLLEKSSKVAGKIMISGGGRCNFTNMNIEPTSYVSQNQHFMKSALSRYTCWDFMDMLARHEISWTEKKLGQLFCDQKAGAIVDVLLKECADAGVKIITQANIETIEYGEGGGYKLATNQGIFTSQKLVMATGALSIPKMGATGYSHSIAKQFGIEITPLKAGLVPFEFAGDDLEFMTSMTGVATAASVSVGDICFDENILFTHRGVSGPAILQVSSYWSEGEAVIIDLMPSVDVMDWLLTMKASKAKSALHTVLSEKWANRFARAFADKYLPKKNMADLSKLDLILIENMIKRWTIYPIKTEGYRTAEVTVGGVNTDYLSSKTMEVKHQPGLYFIGECVDVTGWLGGYNFQWAWSSGWVAAQSL